MIILIKYLVQNKGANYNMYSNPKIDELLQKARETDVDADRVKYYKEFQEEMTKQMPYTFICLYRCNICWKEQCKRYNT